MRTYENTGSPFWETAQVLLTAYRYRSHSHSEYDVKLFIHENMAKSSCIQEISIEILRNKLCTFTPYFSQVLLPLHCFKESVWGWNSDLSGEESCNMECYKFVMRTRDVFILFVGLHVGKSKWIELVVVMSAATMAVHKCRCDVRLHSVELCS